MSQEYGKSYQTRKHLPWGLLLAAGYLMVLVGTSDMGFCRDEGYYFRAGQMYITWVERAVTQVRTGRKLTALTRPEIERYWKYNSEHPPLAKLLMGGSWWLFSKKLKWMSNSLGFRFPQMVWSALMVLIVFLWGAQVWNLRVGFFAAFALMLLPRFFFHAHLAAFDVPISALWLMVVYAFWRSLKSPGWGMLCGVFFGLALATKHNSWILPAPLGVYWLCQYWNKFRVKILPNGTYQVRFPSLPSSVFWSLLLGPLILFALWPLLWPADLTSLVSWKKTTWFWLVSYVKFHLHHVHYDAYYFGVLYLKPPFPWSFPFGMTLVTFPLVTVVLILGGLWFLLREQRLGTHMVWWFVRLVQTFFSLLRPLLGLLILAALLVPLVVLLVTSIGLWLIGLMGFLVPGGLGTWVRERSTWGRLVLQDLRHDLESWNRWAFFDSEGEKDYRPRPVGPADKTSLLWLLNAFIPILIIALPSTPIFGGTKHWMPAWPFLALLAGVGFERICVALKRGWLSGHDKVRSRPFYVSLAVLLMLPAAIGLVRSHPHGLAYYNTLVGGPRGSANWKLQRAFWASSMRQALPWMNANLKDARGSKRGAVWVHFHDTNWDAYNMYRRDRLISPRVRATWRPYHNTRYIAFIHQKWLRTQLYHALSVLGARAPVYGVYLDDVPLLTFWEKSGKKTPVHW